MFDYQRLCSQLRIALSAPPVSLNLLIMKQIFCEHPVIIRNPQLKELLIAHRCYTNLTIMLKGTNNFVKSFLFHISVF